MRVSVEGSTTHPVKLKYGACVHPSQSVDLKCCSTPSAKSRTLRESVFGEVLRPPAPACDAMQAV